ncbi:hypothetical protein [Nocardia abscessus]|uniref:hypothetical protein n=1 Tax=Nocardia abscessus TaxID=120957 RepID=UPI002457845E|nr:hypothetical protein [Nocardia abscessus]
MRAPPRTAANPRDHPTGPGSSSRNRRSIGPACGARGAAHGSARITFRVIDSPHAGCESFSRTAEYEERTLPYLETTDGKEYPTAGHGLYITHADQLNQDLLDFMKS